MQDTFKVNQNLSLFEFYKASLYLSLRNKRLKKFYYLVPGLLFVTSLSSILLSPKTDLNFYTIIFQVVISTLFPVIFFFVGVFLICFLFKLIKPNNFKNIIYEFNHWGMVKKGIGFEYSNPWRSFKKIKETKSFLLLYISENDAHVIQKRMFPTKNELETFKEFADQNIWSNN